MRMTQTVSNVRITGNAPSLSPAIYPAIDKARAQVRETVAKAMENVRAEIPSLPVFPNRTRRIPFARGPRGERPVSGMGFDPFSAAVTLGAAYLSSSGKKKSGEPGSATGSDGYPGTGAGPITVSPSIQTQVSPQISPVFQQAWQPQAPMTAGTTQTIPTSQVASTGQPDASRQFATGIPSDMPDAFGRQPSLLDTAASWPIADQDVMQASMTQNWRRYLSYLIGASLIVGAAVLLTKRRRPEPTHAQGA